LPAIETVPLEPDPVETGEGSAVLPGSALLRSLRL